ncbi:class I SAM-dependent DNA methyltransferase [Streptomyces yaanensis]|uniref:Class I SAM-dependent DNA methyltransferase n=1 Tax=Streptomyces yaanensis TaxID=1142239 RepID=A0ABV7SEI8_9ACTN|nr:methyltransferase domain-containing protein [Streptomyces sp. CGMCC 4.7035]WNB98613.1 methyltransferase domain-containing protein [Streptomyces sp. CGMCC 4.7035]
MTETAHLRTTRASYDTVAVDYDRLSRSELDNMPFDRAMLGVFAERVLGSGGGPVGDLGCGPGRVTTYLDKLGLDAFGIDLSPRMVAVARQAYPGLRFEVGSMTGLDIADGTLAGALAWYSTVHTPPQELPALFEEFHRVLAPGGYLLLAFKVGDECVHLDHAYGHDLSLDVYRFPPELVSELLGRAGFEEVARLVRAADEREKTPQAYILVRRPV